MALNWDLREIAGFDADEESEWQKGHGQYTEALIWYVMFTSLGWQVTEENVEEFIARIRVLEGWGQGVLAGENPVVPEEAIRAHIGLRCNVSPEPRAPWLLRQFAHAFPNTKPGCPECGSRREPLASLTWTDDSGSRARLDSMVLETRCVDCSHLVRTDGAFTTKMLVVS